MGSEENLELFYSELPVLKLLGKPYYISPDDPYDVDSDVQLVCKYLRAYKNKNIDRLYRDRGPRALVQFSCDSDLPDEECHSLLKTYMPNHISCSKITQHLFIRFVKRFSYNFRSGRLHQ